jgi:hypothetical protein
VPLAFVDEDPPDRSRSLADSSGENGNDGFDLSLLQETEKRSLHRIDAGKKAALNPRISQGVPEIADFPLLADAHIQKRTVAAKSKGYLRPHFIMGLTESLQGKVGHHVPVVAEEGLVLLQEVFNVFQSSRRVQKDGFVAKGDGHAPPLPVWKPFRINPRAVMGIHDETVHAGVTEMIHYVSDDGTPSNLQERLRTMLGQRAKPRPQAGAQDEGSLESPSVCPFLFHHRDHREHRDIDFVKVKEGKPFSFPVRGKM